MTLLEKPSVVTGPKPPAARRFEWILWVDLAFLIVAGITAGILLSVGTGGVPVDEVGAELALDNYVAANRISAIGQAASSDRALEFTSFRVLEEMFPGRLEMLETSAGRADQALSFTIARALGG